MKKLLTIKRVNDFRSLQGWVSDSDLRPFAHYNVIFGVNWSGKSTLAALLAKASGDEDWTSGLEVLVEVDGTRSRSINRPGDPFWESIRVFNIDYVERNLRFEDDSGSSAVPLLVLGEKRVGAEEERAKALARLAEIAKALPEIENARKAAVTERDRLATDTARTISEELQGVAATYSPRSYKAPQVRRLIEQGAVGDPKLDVARELRIARASNLPALSVPTHASFKHNELTKQVDELLQQTAQSVAIEELVAHPDWNRWVQTGLELHEGQAKCIFCDHPLTETRVKALHAHFDESLQRLERQLDTLEDELRTLRDEADRETHALPAASQIAEKFRAEYEGALKVVLTSLETMVREVDSFLSDVTRKRDSLFKPISPQKRPQPTDVSLEAVAELMRKHNAYAADSATDRMQAAVRVETARAASIAERFKEQDKIASENAAEARKLGEERERLELSVKQTDETDLDPLPMADRLNEDLSHLLGRDDLKFVADDRGYRIMRNGIPATHLSEGERNAISLLYFLRSLEGHNTKCEECVVVIDDPVSSLDNNSLVAASALLWSRLVKRCGQLIILTHNFELFRTWGYQLQNARHLGKNRYSLYEMKSRVVAGSDGKPVRQPQLVNWPKDYFMEKRLRSEYHYLFWTVMHTVAELDQNPTPEMEIEAATILPNVCRRLLEIFLAFRHPAAVDNLSELVLEASPESVDKDTRTRVLRFVHTYSHSEEADIARPITRPETLANVRAVLKFMSAIDKEHFTGMCEALEVSL